MYKRGDLLGAYYDNSAMGLVTGASERYYRVQVLMEGRHSYEIDLPHDNAHRNTFLITSILREE